MTSAKWILTYQTSDVPNPLDISSNPQLHITWNPCQTRSSPQEKKHKSLPSVLHNKEIYKHQTYDVEQNSQSKQKKKGARE